MRTRLTAIVAAAIVLIVLLGASAPGLADQNIISGTPSWQNVPDTSGQQGYVQQINGQNYWFQTGTDPSTGQTVVENIQLDLGYVYGYWWTATNGDQVFVETDQTGQPVAGVDYTQSNLAAQSFQEVYNVQKIVPTTITVLPLDFMAVWIPELGQGAYAPSLPSGAISPTSVDTSGWAAPYWGVVELSNPNQYDIEYSSISAGGPDTTETYLSNLVVPGTSDPGAAALYQDGDLALFDLYLPFVGQYGGPPEDSNDWLMGSNSGQSLIYDGQSYPIITNPGFTNSFGFPLTDGYGTLNTPATIGDFALEPGLGSGYPGGAPGGGVAEVYPTTVYTQQFQPWPGQTVVGNVVGIPGPGYAYDNIGDQRVTAGFSSAGTFGTETNNGKFTALVSPISYNGGGEGWSGYVYEQTDGPSSQSSDINGIEEDVSFPAETLLPGETVYTPAQLYHWNYNGQTYSKQPYTLPNSTPQSVFPFTWEQSLWGGASSGPAPVYLLNRDMIYGVQDNYTSQIIIGYHTVPNPAGWPEDESAPTLRAVNTATANIPGGNYVVQINDVDIAVDVPPTSSPATMTAVWSGSPSWKDVDAGRAEHEAVLQSIVGQVNAYSGQTGVSAHLESAYPQWQASGGDWIELYGSVPNAVEWSTKDVQGDLLQMLGLTPVLVPDFASGTTYLFPGDFSTATFYTEWAFHANNYWPGYIDNAVTDEGLPGHYYAWDVGSIYGGGGNYYYGDMFAFTGATDQDSDPELRPVSLGYQQVQANDYFNYISRGRTSSYPLFGTTVFQSPVIVRPN